MSCMRAAYALTVPHNCSDAPKSPLLDNAVLPKFYVLAQILDHESWTTVIETKLHVYTSRTQICRNVHVFTGRNFLACTI